MTEIEILRRGVVAVVGRGSRLLAIRRSAIVVAPLAFCFPGGGIEPGETEPGAFVREMFEELGVEARPLKRLWESVTPWGTHLAWWQTELAAGVELTPNPLEVAEIHWLETAEMLALPELLESNRDFLAALEAGRFTLDATA